MNRKELIEIAKRHGQSAGSVLFDQVCRPAGSDVEMCATHEQAQLLCVANESAVAAVDAALSAVADDLKARRDFRALPPFGISDPAEERGARFALGAYSHFLRSVTEEAL